MLAGATQESSQLACQAAEKSDYFVILSEAKNLSSVYVHEKEREIPRFAQNDKRSGAHFFSACYFCRTPMP
jgi:hypothetical protein